MYNADTVPQDIHIPSSEPVTAEEVHIPNYRPLKIAGGLLALGLPLAFAGGGGGGKGGDKQADNSTDKASVEKAAAEKAAAEKAAAEKAAAEKAAAEKAAAEKAAAEKAAAEKAAAEKAAAEKAAAEKAAAEKAAAEKAAAEKAAAEKAAAEKAAAEKAAAEKAAAEKAAAEKAAAEKAAAEKAAAEKAAAEKDAAEKDAAEKAAAEKAAAEKAAAEKAAAEKAAAEKAAAEKAAAEKDAAEKDAAENTMPSENTDAAETVTTRILYGDGATVTLTTAKQDSVDLSALEYRTASAMPSESNRIVYRRPSESDLDRLNKFIAENPKLTAKNINTAFQKDSDGDGLIDSKDRYPDMWNVSDRDLRMFSTLAYATEGKAALQQAFSEKAGSVEIDSIKANLNGQVDISEYQNHWDVLEVVNKGEWFGSGLDYVIFGNGKQTDGSYQNVVVAFRGTKALQDATAGLKLAQGDTPTQAKEMNEIISKLEQYNPDHIYSTGHSLGGYLAQYFAAYTVQNSPFKDEFVRSVLFNTAKITTDSSSTSDLHTALARSEQFSQERIYDAHFTNQSGITYKTNSYVINGEWLSSGDVPIAYQAAATVAAGVADAVKPAIKGGFWGALLGLGATILTGGAAAPLVLAGAKAGATVGATVGGAKGAETVLTFNGLGTYKNTIFLDNTAADKDGWNKHDLVNFYETSTEVQKYFSQGYRVDKNQETAYKNTDSDKDGLSDYQELRVGTHSYTQDTDDDGFSDGLEAKLNSDGNRADSVPYAVTEPAQTADLRPVLAVVQTEAADGTVLSVKGVEMAAVREGGETVYRPSENGVTEMKPDGFDWDAFSASAHRGTAVLSGTDGNDVLTGSSGSDRLWGNLGSDTISGRAGADTFVFTAADIAGGQADRITDFDIREDKLDLAGLRGLFSDHDEGFAWDKLFSDDAGQSGLVFDHDAQTLAYRAAGGDSTVVFARFDNDAAITAAQIVG
ncbi:histone H1-like repetitive region-containing protein [Neisseria sp. CCUG12390]|uniref:histone H1-like repetitive region-containing protein n=1 Tax=Neisseria sp. CCUG12390 TaxID=3392035 RepID=UPI003A0FDF9A